MYFITAKLMLYCLMVELFKGYSINEQLNCETIYHDLSLRHVKINVAESH